MRLRTALSSVEGYMFYYVDDHHELADQLRSDRPALVFDLCDEGFNNDPDMELHVPALLEMLGIAYTGAPPSCWRPATTVARAGLGARDEHSGAGRSAAGGGGGPRRRRLFRCS